MNCRLTRVNAQQNVFQIFDIFMNKQAVGTIASVVVRRFGWLLCPLGCQHVEHQHVGLGLGWHGSLCVCNRWKTHNRSFCHMTTDSSGLWPSGRSGDPLRRGKNPRGGENKRGVHQINLMYATGAALHISTSGCWPSKPAAQGVTPWAWRIFSYAKYHMVMDLTLVGFNTARPARSRFQEVVAKRNMASLNVTLTLRPLDDGGASWTNKK